MIEKGLNFVRQRLDRGTTPEYSSPPSVKECKRVIIMCLPEGLIAKYISFLGARLPPANPYPSNVVKLHAADQIEAVSSWLCSADIPEGASDVEAFTVVRKAKDNF